MSIPRPTSWPSLGQADSADLIEARTQLHWAAQLPAAFGHVLVPPREDFTHQTLTWAAPDLLVSEPCSGWRAGLRLADLTLELRDAEGTPQAELGLAGRSLSEGLSWLGSAAAEALGAAASSELEVPGFDIPAHAVGAQGRFDPPASGLSELSGWYAAAAEALSEIGNALGAPDVRCWPHHFDIATLVSVTPANGDKEARTVGIGMTPGDGGYPEPYWYVTPWPYPRAELLAPLEVGHWHLEGWTGGVLTHADTIGTDDRRGRVRGFLRQAEAAARAALTASS